MMKKSEKLYVVTMDLLENDLYNIDIFPNLESAKIRRDHLRVMSDHQGDRIIMTLSDYMKRIYAEGYDSGLDEEPPGASR